jgi:hypothetical protein
MIETSGRSETEDLFRSGIAVDMGGAAYWLRPLTMDGVEEWEAKIRDVLSAMFGNLGLATGGIDGILGLYRQSVDAQLDALYAYDELGRKPVLPARSELRRSASRDDVDVALRKLVKHEFPLLKGMDFIGTWVPMEVREIITRQLIKLLPEPSSPSQPSTNDSSTSTPPTKIRLRSPRR